MGTCEQFLDPSISPLLPCLTPTPGELRALAARSTAIVVGAGRSPARRFPFKPVTSPTEVPSTAFRFPFHVEAVARGQIADEVIVEHVVPGTHFDDCTFAGFLEPGWTDALVLERSDLPQKRLDRNAE